MSPRTSTAAKVTPSKTSDNAETEENGFSITVSPMRSVAIHMPVLAQHESLADDHADDHDHEDDGPDKSASSGSAVDDDSTEHLFGEEGLQKEKIRTSSAGILTHFQQCASPVRTVAPSLSYLPSEVPWSTEDSLPPSPEGDFPVRLSTALSMCQNITSETKFKQN